MVYNMDKKFKLERGNYMKKLTNWPLLLSIIILVIIDIIMIYVSFINIRYANSLTVGVNININNFYYPITGNGIDIPIITLTLILLLITFLLIRKYLKIFDKDMGSVIVLKLNIKNNTLAFIPFIIFLIFYISVFKYSNHLLMIVTLFLTFIIGLALIKKSNIIEILGIISLITFLLIFSIIGYYDYIKWASTIIGIIVVVYYIIIYLCLYKKFKK